VTVEKLAESEKAKDILLRELHHRTKNNMSIMAALLRAQARAAENRETQDALISAARRINIMGTLQEYLRPSKTDNRVALGDYLHELSMRMEELRPNTAVNIVLDSENIEISERLALPLGIVINELVTNSLKYAFPDGRDGTVEIKVWKDGVLVLEVSDNGIGCPEDAKQGVGTRLMELMAKQVHGTIERQPKEQGCKTLVRVPLD
jgi:two-component sensor histidine kinase